jgi:8-oxo-dGTP pyrophosphatase MutT (NUDIX family)
MWKKLSSKIVFEHPRLIIIEDKVELPDGTTTSYIRYKNTGNAVTIICKNEEGKLLLQEDYSYPPNKKLIQFPGGWIPQEEDIEKGAKREFEEETGFIPITLKLIRSYLMNNRRTDSRMYVFEVNGVTEGKQKLDKEEVGTKNIWLSEKEFQKRIKQGKIENQHTLASWALYKSSNVLY